MAASEESIEVDIDRMFCQELRARINRWRVELMELQDAGRDRKIAELQARINAGEVRLQEHEGIVEKFDARKNEPSVEAAPERLS